ncbi:hypothetical protein [Chitinophaga sp. S165]|uniref:hypothetical protein n=1 Tax=Chitinophaga sp. S165 TaxID=2135462 RepID=UPI000D82E699|nr:hypothetical protein [Chitinophaga sp. S165]PWV49726.1 hypothetical protein C7475_105234 [Chitinophaga sp. S165]
MLTQFLGERKDSGIPRLRYTIDMKMMDYADRTFFKQKLEMAKASIAKYGVLNMRSFYEEEEKAAAHKG